MKIVLFALFVAVVYFVFLGISRWIEALAYEQRNRYFHIRTIIATLLVLLLATNVYTVSFLIDLIDGVINNPTITGVLSQLLPNRAYALGYMFLMFVGLNLLVAVAVLITVIVVKLIFSWKNKYLDYDEYTGFGRIIHLPWLVVNCFYENNKGSVRLKPKGFSFGKWVKGMKTAFATLWLAQTVILALSILWGGEAWNELLLSVSKAWYLLPMASYFLLQQVQLFLDGTFYDETGGFSSSKISAGVLSKMEELLKLYRHHLGDSGVLLLSDYHKERPQNSGLGGNRLGNRQIHDCQNREILEVVVNHIKQSDIHMNDAYKNALVSLLNGNSVNICDHFGGEFLLYLCSYLNFFMSQGKTVLILCPSRERVKNVAAAVDKAMNRLNNLCSVWNVNMLEDSADHCHMNILVCTADEFIQGNVVERRKEFAEDIFCTVLVDGFELFSRDCIRTHQTFSALHSLDSMQQYILFTEDNNDALRTAMELVTQKELLPFCHETLRPGTGIMVWGEESAFRIQRQLGIGNQISPYMGTAIPLAILAAKYDVDKVHIVQSPNRADRTYMDVLSMCQTEVKHFVKKSANLQSMIRTDNSEILNNPDDKIIIAYDTEYNFYHTIWRWVKYGGAKKTLIHIISPSYLLREYFVDKYYSGQMLLRTNDFDPLISYHQGMKATRMAIILVTLCKSDMTERELMKKSREYGWGYENVVDLLRDCLQVVLTDHEIHSVYSHFQFKRKTGFVFSKEAFESETIVSLTDDVIRRRLEKKISIAHLVCQNNQHTDLSVLAGNVHNYYLRDQIVAIDGHFYQISLINNGNVYAEQKNHSEAPEYLQISDFEFKNYTRVDACVDTGYLDINICTASVRRKIYGYWETTHANSFGKGAGLMLHDLRGEGDGICVDFDNAGIMEINIPRSLLGENAVETVRLFAYTLKELFRTLFPHSHQNLFTAIREEDGSSYGKAIFTPTDHSVDEKAASLIPTVAPGFDAPCADRITLFVVEASCLEYGMVQMLYERRMDVFRMLREYLEWYQSCCAKANAGKQDNTVGNTDGAAANTGAASVENASVDRPEEVKAAVEAEAVTSGPASHRAEYLHFGSDHIPTVFSLKGLLHLCSKIAPVTVVPMAPPKPDVQPEDTRNCSFCGAPTMMPTELQEGRVRRIMCRDCADHRCTAEDEVKRLYHSTFASMMRDYDIGMPDNLMVRFQTADAIAKFTGVGGNGDGGRVLGFYYHAGRQLWLESSGPEVALRSTLFHELTHAWQHYDRRFDDSLRQALRRFKRKYRDLARLLLVEGHAMYVEIDGMWEHHEMVYAERLRQITEKRQDEYGIGYLFVREYLDEYRTEGSHVTPFVAMQRLVDEIADGKEPKDKLQALILTLMGE